MITEHDREFARDLVRLARKHGAGKLSVEFCLSSSKNFRRSIEGGYVRYEDVKMDWSEGRHGASTDLHLSARVFITEKEPVVEEEATHADRT